MKHLVIAVTCNFFTGLWIVVEYGLYSLKTSGWKKNWMKLLKIKQIDENVQRVVEKKQLMEEI